MLFGLESVAHLSEQAPASFALDRVIPCWAEGIARMKPGGAAKLTCPPKLAYGDRGNPPAIPGGAALVFEVKLLKVTRD
jgi:FKBP-type peptidyl-prolyl cis-trans isomerase FkpA